MNIVTHSVYEIKDLIICTTEFERIIPNIMYRKQFNDIMLPTVFDGSKDLIVESHIIKEEFSDDTTKTENV